MRATFVTSRRRLWLYDIILHISSGLTLTLLLQSLVSKVESNPWERWTDSRSSYAYVSQGWSAQPMITSESTLRVESPGKTTRALAAYVRDWNHLTGQTWKVDLSANMDAWHDQSSSRVVQSITWLLLAILTLPPYLHVRCTICIFLDRPRSYYERSKSRNLNFDGEISFDIKLYLINLLGFTRFKNMQTFADCFLS